MEQRLARRRTAGTLRRLPAAPAAAAAAVASASEPPLCRSEPIDFASNDYLGLARDVEQQRLVEREMSRMLGNRGGSNSGRKPIDCPAAVLGATGSRLLTGDAAHYHALEREIAAMHRGAAALLCNSGYDANLSVVSSLPSDVILYDAAAHNSLLLGMRLWQSSRGGATQHARICASFQHNSVDDLRRQLAHHSSENLVGRTIAVLVESVYSMDGDVAPLASILDAALEYNAVVVVDEAHGLGVYGHHGMGVLSQTGCERHAALAYAVYTFGKAAGCHGAVIVCPHSRTPKDYLVNYAQPFIYSTALPLHAVVTIQCAYGTLAGGKGRRLRRRLSAAIAEFRRQLPPALAAVPQQQHHHHHYPNHTIRLLSSPSARSSPIQALLVPGSAACADFCRRFHRLCLCKGGEGGGGNIRLYPIVAPTVAVGRERVRIVLHAHNTPAHVRTLVAGLVATVREVTTTPHAKL